MSDTDLPEAKHLELKRLRTQRGLTAADLTRISGLSRRTISAIEDERYEDLPPGIYARSSLRAYARTIGLDPAAVLDVLERRLPEATVDLGLLAELRSPRRRPARWRYVLAAAVDAALLLGIDVTIVYVCGLFCDMSATHLIETAPVAMAVLCSTPIALHFWLFGATGVLTAGPRLLGVEILPPTDDPLPLDVWLRRGLLYVKQEAKLAMRVATRAIG